MLPKLEAHRPVRMLDTTEDLRKVYGPLTEYQMSLLYLDYVKALKLAEHNSSGRNPSYPGMYGQKMGDTLRAKASRIAREFPEIPIAYARTEKK